MLCWERIPFDTQCHFKFGRNSTLMVWTEKILRSDKRHLTAFADYLIPTLLWKTNRKVGHWKKSGCDRTPVREVILLQNLLRLLLTVFPIRPEVGNISLVAGQKTLQGLAGRTNFLPTIPFPLLFMVLKLGNLWNFNQKIFTVHKESPKYDIQYIYSTVRFLIVSRQYSMKEVTRADSYSI